MIKYNTKLGSKHLNIEARQKKSLMQLQTKGMHCRKCKDQHTMINFESSEHGILVPRITACCIEFDDRLRKVLFSQNDL